MKIGILGAGALGSLLGAYLSEEHEVVLYGRKSHLDAINHSGLRVSGVKGERSYQVIGREDLTNERFDLGIVGVKSYDTKSILQKLDREKVNLDFVASIQNGLKDKILIEHFGKDKVLGCTVDEGARMVSAGHVHYTNQGFSYYGNLREDEKNPRKEELADILSSSLTRFGLVAHPSNQMERLTWYKFMTANTVAVNGALNLDSAQKYLNPYARELFLKTVEEIMLVTQAEEIKLAEHPVLSGIFLQDTKSRKDSIEKKIEKSKRKKEPHVPSLVQDLRKGKSITEADNTLGTMLSIAEKHSILTPTLRFCYQMIKAKEYDNGQRSTGQKS
jgi:2-dehydropantoate 2-reductase